MRQDLKINKKAIRAGYLPRLRALYRTMSLTRQVEAALARLFANCEVPAFFRLRHSREAVAAGIIRCRHAAVCGRKKQGAKMHFLKIRMMI